MAALEIEFGPQSLAVLNRLIEALKGFKLPEEEDSGGLMSRREAAKFLGISLSTLDAWGRRGVLPVPVELSERNQRFRKSDLIEFASKRRSAA